MFKMKCLINVGFTKLTTKNILRVLTMLNTLFTTIAKRNSKDKLRGVFQNRQNSLDNTNKTGINTS